MFGFECELKLKGDGEQCCHFSDFVARFSDFPTPFETFFQKFRDKYSNFLDKPYLSSHFAH